MPTHEYKVLAAPRHGVRAKGARTPEARFALAVEAEINRLAAEGWEYLRSDTLPCEERQGWLGTRATVPRTVLVFRRAPAEADLAQAAPPAAYAEPPAALPPFLSPPPAAPRMALDGATLRAHPSPATPRRVATPPLSRPAMPPVAPPAAPPEPRGDLLAVPEPRPAPPLDAPERP